LQQFVRLIRIICKVVAQSLDAGARRVIVVHDRCRFANPLVPLSLERSRTPRIIEDLDSCFTS
jgi:hypothetical protein